MCSWCTSLASPPPPGAGTQFFILFLSLLALGGVGTYYPYNRGAMKTSIVIIYVVTSCAWAMHDRAKATPRVRRAAPNVRARPGVCARVGVPASPAVVSGWVSASLYKQMTGEKWVWATMMTAAIVPGTCAVLPERSAPCLPRDAPAS